MKDLKLDWGDLKVRVGGFLRRKGIKRIIKTALMGAEDELRPVMKKWAEELVDSVLATGAFHLADELQDDTHIDILAALAGMEKDELVARVMDYGVALVKDVLNQLWPE